MRKITAENCISLIIERFPKFQIYWDSYVKDFGMEQGITIQMLPFSEYVIDVLKFNEKSEIIEIFSFVEFLLYNGDESVKNAITTSFLEYLLSKDPKEIKFSNFSKYLGETTIDYCRAWDKFTGVKTEGL
jgi:hypothetical protein